MIVGLEDFDQWQRFNTAVAVDIHRDGDDLELDRVAIALRVAPVRQGD